MPTKFILYDGNCNIILMAFFGLRRVIVIYLTLPSCLMSKWLLEAFNIIFKQQFYFSKSPLSFNLQFRPILFPTFLVGFWNMTPTPTFLNHKGKELSQPLVFFSFRISYQNIRPYSIWTVLANNFQTLAVSRLLI